MALSEGVSQMGATGTHEQVLLNVREVARLLHLGERTIWKLSTTGELPSPIRIGRSRRWDRRAIEAWLAAKRAEAEKEQQRIRKSP